MIKFFSYMSTIKVAGNSFQHFLMGHYNHSISVDAKIMASKNFPIISNNVAVNFVAQ